MNNTNTNTYTLKENVLTDDILIVPSRGYRFKRGIIAIVKQYSYQNPNSDKETIIEFTSKRKLFKFIDENYKNKDKDFDIDYEIEF